MGPRVSDGDMGVGGRDRCVQFIITPDMRSFFNFREKMESKGMAQPAVLVFRSELQLLR